MPPTQENFGSRLRRERVINGLSQADLAAKLSVTQPTISTWEQGSSHPRPAQRQKLVEIFGPGIEGREDELPATLSGISPFGQWLTETRRARGLSVKELAERAGLSIPAIYAIENGSISNPRQTTVKALEQALNARVPADTAAETEEEAQIEGLGELEGFDPHSDEDLPDGPGVYVFYDISQRPIYVGESGRTKSRIKEHREKFWFRPPIVQTGAFVAIQDEDLRHKVESLLIQFLKRNAVLNRQKVHR
jgi:transcriptional regulator with XRE-family HTH domain